MARPSTPLLSRSLIALEAIAMVDEGRELHVAPLAKRLGVSPSSLYNHVKGRGDLVHAMRSEVASEMSAAPAGTGDWRERLRAELTFAWEIYTRHPRLVPHLIGVIIDEPNVLQHYRRIAQALLDAGLPDTEVAAAVAALDAFALGAALDSLSPDRLFELGAVPQGVDHLLANQPIGVERNHAAFAIGLSLLIGGIAARAVGPGRNSL